MASKDKRAIEQSVEANAFDYVGLELCDKDGRLTDKSVKLPHGYAMWTEKECDNVIDNQELRGVSIDKVFNVYVPIPRLREVIGKLKRGVDYKKLVTPLKKKPRAIAVR